MTFPTLMHEHFAGLIGPASIEPVHSLGSHGMMLVFLTQLGDGPLGGLNSIGSIEVANRLIMPEVAKAIKAPEYEVRLHDLNILRSRLEEGPFTAATSHFALSDFTANRDLPIHIDRIVQSTFCSEPSEDTGLLYNNFLLTDKIYQRWS